MMYTWTAAGLSDPAPADIDGIRRLAGAYDTAAIDADNLVRTLTHTTDQQTEWTGGAAEAFHGSVRKIPPDLGRIATSYGRIRDALRVYANSLEGEQHSAQKLLVDAVNAQQRLHAAQRAMAAGHGSLIAVTEATGAVLKTKVRWAGISGACAAAAAVCVAELVAAQQDLVLNAFFQKVEPYVHAALEDFVAWSDDIASWAGDTSVVLAILGVVALALFQPELAGPLLMAAAWSNRISTAAQVVNVGARELVVTDDLVAGRDATGDVKGLVVAGSGALASWGIGRSLRSSATFVSKQVGSNEALHKVLLSEERAAWGRVGGLTSHLSADGAPVKRIGVALARGEARIVQVGVDEAPKVVGESLSYIPDKVLDHGEDLVKEDLNVPDAPVQAARSWEDAPR